jgi:hypothetical protein
MFDQVLVNPMAFKIPWDFKDETNVLSKWELVIHI